MSGRFAPSPTGDLHVGNLRTALAAWLLARSGRRGFIVRMEDLDLAQASHDNERRQLDDLAALGIDHDGEVVRQSDRFDRYRDAIARLERDGLVYPCWCSRREIAAAAAAPHGTPPAEHGVADAARRTIDVPPNAYPGTCREQSSRERRERDATGRPPALRLRTDDTVRDWHDAVHGPRRGRTDDFVLRRADGVPAYNVAVVIDDHVQGVSQVVRGDDLLSSTARHLHLQQLLGFAMPEYAHVPLVLGADGERLAKRHGAVTLADLGGVGVSPPEVLRSLARSLDIGRSDGGLADVGTAGDLLDVDRPFEISRVPKGPVVVGDLLADRVAGDPSP